MGRRLNGTRRRLKRVMETKAVFASRTLLCTRDGEIAMKWMKEEWKI